MINQSHEAYKKKWNQPQVEHKERKKEHGGVRKQT
jgi:hypothetical protein